MTPTPLGEMREAVTKLLRLRRDDQPSVDYVIALIGANYLKGYADLTWGWFTGPPGSCKTEVVRMFRPLDYTYFTSTLTANALASGVDREDGKDPSVFAHIDGKILIIKDFTAAYSDKENTLTKITGDLRDANDGFYGKESGKVGRRSYDNQFGLIFCFTGILDAFAFSKQCLGERMLVMRVSRTQNPRAERTAHIRHVWEAAAGKKEWRDAVAKLVVRCMDEYMKRLGQQEAGSIIIPDRYAQQLSEIVDLMVTVRTAPLSNHGLTGDPEVGSRLGLQMHHLGLARLIADRRTEWDQSDMDFILRVGVDTLPSFLRRSLQVLYNSPEAITPDALAYYANIDGVLVGEIIRQWRSVGVLDPKKTLLVPDVRQQIEATGLLGPPPASS